MRKSGTTKRRSTTKRRRTTKRTTKRRSITKSTTKRRSLAAKIKSSSEVSNDKFWAKYKYIMRANSNDKKNACVKGVYNKQKCHNSNGHFCYDKENKRCYLAESKKIWIQPVNNSERGKSQYYYNKYRKKTH